MKKIILCLILLLLQIMIGCVFNVGSQNPKGDYSIYGGSSKTIDKGSKKGGSLDLYLLNYRGLMPLNPKSRTDFGFFNIIYSKLFKIGNDYEISGELIEEYEYDGNNKELTLKLKDGLRWSDGSSITADDIIFTLKSIQNIKNGYYDSCKTNIGAVIKKDSQTVKIILKEDNPNFIYNLSIPIISKPEENNPYKFSGPYRIISEDSTKISLEINDKWYKSFNDAGKIPNIEEIIMHKYKNSGEIFTDFLTRKLDFLYIPNELFGTFENRTDIKSFEFISDEYEMLIFNTKSKFYENALTKRIINSLLKPEIITEPLKQDSIHVIRIPTGEYLDPGIKKYQKIEDEEKTEFQKLKKSERTIEILYNSENRDRRIMVDRIKTILENYGFIINLTITEYSEYTNKLISGEYDIAVAGLQMSYEPFSEFIYNPFINDFRDIYNKRVSIDSGFEDERLLDLGRKFKASPDTEVYFNIIIDIIDREIPYLGLYYKKEEIAFSSGIKGNISPTRNNVFSGIEDWYLEER